MAKAKILLVDDVKANIIALRRLLSTLDAELQEVMTARDALRSLLNNDFALILLDIQLPDINGIELAEIIRSEESTSKVPIILLTANYMEEHYQFRGYEAGAVDYLLKPINEKILLSKVKVFLDLYNFKARADELSYQNKLILNAAGEGVIGLDNKAKVVFANPAARNMLGENIVNRFLSEILISNSDTEPSIEYLLSKAQSWKEAIKKPRENRYSFIADQGHRFPVEYTVTLIEDRLSDMSYVLVFQDITERNKLESQLTYMARTDALTGLANRSCFHAELKDSIRRSKRQKKISALIFLDMDRFKSINDTLGHTVGDKLLRQVASRLMTVVRETDQVARFGGDEFTIIGENFNKLGDIDHLAQKILSSVNKPFNIDGQDLLVTFSAGIVMYPACGEDVETLIKHADVAMYRAKEQGGNRYRFFDTDMGEEISRRVSMERSLCDAIDRDELFLVYQPKLDIVRRRVIGFEALVRWGHPDKGVVMPGEFIGLAEEIGLINRIGDWVLTQAARERKRWQTYGMPDDIRMAVNLSSHQFTHCDIFQQVADIMGDVGIQPSLIELEITESCLIQDPLMALKVLNQIAETGISLSIDDFGTGFSSLNQLKSLPVNTIKIDKSFVRDIATDKNDEAIVRAIISMAESLNIEVIAEGVENQLQLDHLARLNCSKIQGYHFSDPIYGDQVLRNFLKPEQVVM